MELDRLLNCLWRAGEFSGRGFVALGGERVRVVSTGEPSDEVRGVWPAAEVVVDDERRRGAVAVGETTAVPDGAVLRVVAAPEPDAQNDAQNAASPTPPRGAAPLVLGIDDRFVTQIEVQVPVPVAERYRALIRGRGGCVRSVAAMDELHRTALYTHLAVERLLRKAERIRAICDGAAGDWHQTLHTLLFQAMGGDRNKEAFTQLATRATALIASREKGSPHRLEALLLGAAGLLFAGEERDDYTLALEDEARHLLAKHSIVPMRPAEWDVVNVRPVNHPALRLAELAALLAARDFLLDGALACRTAEDVERLFAIRASDYWLTHYAPSGPAHPPSNKTIGRTKTHLVGINLVAPLMFAYGRRAGREELCEAAIDLLSAIPPERNRKLERWYDGGCAPRSAFESQSLIELEDSCCARHECADCRVGRAAIKKSVARVAVPQ